MDQSRPIAGGTVRPSVVYYGWYIVAAALVAQFVAIGTQSYAPGVFLKPMTEDLGWSREAFSAAQTLSTVVMGGTGLLVGVLVDRRGPRPLMAIGAVVAGATLVAISAVDSLWQFYLLRGVGQTIGGAMMGNLVVNVTVARWFVLRRGMAIAIASTGVSLGGVLLTPVLSWWISDFGWRTSWVILGVTVWALVLPSAMVMRRSPEDAGLLPDGMTAEEAAAFSVSHHSPSAASEVQWTQAEAVRTRAIWLIIFAFGSASMGLTAMLLHLISYLSDSGFRLGTAALLFTAMSWAALAAKFIWGALMTRFQARHLSAVAFGISGLGILALIASAPTASEPLVALNLFAYGLGIGGVIPLQETVWASYFGRVHLGTIRAVAMPFSILFGAGGPLLAGSLYTRAGSYTAAFATFAAFSFLGLVLILLARPPRKPQVGTPPPQAATVAATLGT